MWLDETLSKFTRNACFTPYQNKLEKKFLTVEVELINVKIEWRYGTYTHNIPRKSTKSSWN